MSDASALLDHSIISDRYFYPRRAAFADPYWVEAADGSHLGCYYRHVDTAAKTVIYFHGNGEVVADYLPDFPEWFVGAGYNCLMAEYRGYGMSTGRPALAGMLDDVERLIDHLEIPDRQVVLFGRSIGSLYALHGVSQRPTLAGLILESGISDLSERFFMRVQPEELGVSREDLIGELQTHFDYANKLSGFKGHTLILHTQHDELVPVDHAERLHAAAPEPKRLRCLSVVDTTTFLCGTGKRICAWCNRLWPPRERHALRFINLSRGTSCTRSTQATRPSLEADVLVGYASGPKRFTSCMRSRWSWSSHWDVSFPARGLMPRRVARSTLTARAHPLA